MAGNSLLFMDMDFTVAVSSESCRLLQTGSGGTDHEKTSGSGVSARSGIVNGGHEFPCF